MGLVDIVVGLILIAFLLVFTLMINPPEAWTKKLTDRKQNRKD